MMTNFHLNTTVVAIFPNVWLLRRSLYSVLVLTLKNRIKPPSYARTAYVVAIWPSFLFDSFVKIWATCETFLGKWFTAHPPWQKISRTPMYEISFIANTPLCLLPYRTYKRRGLRKLIGNYLYKLMHFTNNCVTCGVFNFLLHHVPYLPRSYLWTKMKEIDFSTLARKSGFCSSFPDRRS